MVYTIRDIAQKAGVSASTVSRALSRPEMVSAATLERVLATARDHGYENLRNASPRTTAAATIGVIVPDLSNQFFSDITRALLRRAWTEDHLMVLGSTSEDILLEQAMARRYATDCSALVLAAPRMDDLKLQALAELGKPLVLINRQVEGLASVIVEVEIGVRQAVTHLAALGHKRIGFVAGPETSRMARVMADAMTREGSSLGVSCEVVVHTEPDHLGGAAAAQIVVASGVTGVIAHNDLVAAGLVARLNDQGIRVPDQLSVIGCDDTAICRITNPRLTTISMDREAIAWAAIDLLLSDSQDEEAMEVAIATRLVVRESTSAPKK